jgi:predicted RNA-binding protein (virulence factor B family)
MNFLSATARVPEHPAGMAVLGQRNSLAVLRESPHGVYLDAADLGEVLMPAKYVSPGLQAGDSVDVFLYRDSEDRLVATTEQPHVLADQCACLKVVGVRGGIGAFLDWGLEKDLLLPLREQTEPLSVDDWVVVKVVVDERSNRLIATTRLKRHLDKTPAPFAAEQPVHLLVAQETPLGYRCVIDHSHWGMLYRTELGGTLRIGDEYEGVVRQVREDGKVDLRLDRAGYRRIAPLADQILEALRQNNGRLELHDKTDPETIREVFACSKKAFKQAVGSLLKAGKLALKDDGIELPRP